MNFVEQLEASLYKGFIDQTDHRTGAFKPKLLVNNIKTNETVLTSLLEELNHCQTFLFSVAFITESGLAALKSHLLDLKQRGITGRILTSTFLSFNKPKVFRELLKITNVEVRLTSLKGFHSKGYIFDHDTHCSLIVGSSNLTAHALKVNYEWNIKLTSHENGEIVYHFKNQFEDVWESSAPLTEAWITEYEKTYVPLTERQAERVAELPVPYENPVEEAVNIMPNTMQQTALREIQAVREAGNDKGLVISATGTGKTYLSAFDVRRFAPRRMLFVVHREQILNKAKSDFKRILGGVDEEFGILSGSTKETDAKYLFATIQTLSKDENLQQFDRAAFDYILIDEVHKAGAGSYQKVIHYFKPRFMMGMTATPERTDDFNIYGLFDYNVAYEIRLQEALEEDMLCPFHYFGVTDFEYSEEQREDAMLLTKLAAKERVDHIIEKAQYYGFSGDSVKGLMFCSRREEAESLSTELNKRGLRTVALTGANSQDDRERQVNKLEQGKLDYILTVDIFNEGIDIPCVNQVVMLRQTESSIVFIQQLGRGLRKHDSKEFVTVIDFIGNYKNNYLIPVALSGDKSQNKDNIRRHVKDTSYIQGVSTVNFEEIAKKRIFQAINKSNLTEQKLLKEAFMELKNRIGYLPNLYNFIEHRSIDPLVIVQKHNNYYQFLLKLKAIEPVLSSYEEKVLTMLSLEVLNGKRAHEIILLDLLLQHKSITQEVYKQALQQSGYSVDKETLRSVERVLNLSFFTQNTKAKYGGRPLIQVDQVGTIHLSEVLQERLLKNQYFTAFVKDALNCAKEKNKTYKNDRPLTLYQKYTRKDACKLLNWENDESSTMYGYKVKHSTCPFFVTYHKQDEVEASIAYGDELLSQEIFRLYTKSNRTLQSEEVQKIIRANELGIDIHVFVKKDDDEGSDFYYLGEAIPDPTTVEQTMMGDKDNKQLPVVRLNVELEREVESKLYYYIKSEN